MARTRSSLALGGTLVLGMVLGALLVGALGQARAARLAGLRRPGGFAEHMERIVQPRDDAQRQALRQILDEVAERNQQIMRDSQDQLRASMEDLRARLEPLLDEAQIERLDRFRGPDPLGPPGGPPGPGPRRGPRRGPR